MYLKLLDSRANIVEVDRWKHKKPPARERKKDKRTMYLKLLDSRANIVEVDRWKHKKPPAKKNIFFVPRNRHQVKSGDKIGQNLHQVIFTPGNIYTR